MKKIVAFLLLGLIYGGCARAEIGKAIINCSFNINTQSGLFLYKLENGEAVSLGFKRPDANRNCQFEVDVKEGIYFFKRAGGKSNLFKYAIYLKEGDQKKVAFFERKTSIDYDSCFIEKPNVETQYLQRWINAFNEYFKLASTKHEQSYSKYDEFEKFAVSFLKANKTGNAYFNGWLTDKVHTDLRYLKAANYFKLGRLNAWQDSAAAVQVFYKSLQDKKLVLNASLLRSEHGMEMLDYIFAIRKFSVVKNTKDLLAESFSENTPAIGNDTVKVAYLSYNMVKIKKYEDFVNYIQPYQKLFVTAEQKAAYQKVYNELMPFAKGRSGYNFEYKDVNDVPYTFKSFQGKVLVVDVWAMWCAPCLAEKPYFEKIEAQYKNRNDIAFIGMSVDGFVKTRAWKDFIKRKGWTNIELLTEPNDTFSKYYSIEGIPRFLVFDKDGRVVTVDAPRPSNPAFKTLIDETLAAGK